MSKEKAQPQQQAMKKKPAKVKKKKQVFTGVAHVTATFNNTIITITDPSGNVIAWASAGKVGYSGSRKSSSFAATIAAQDAGKSAMSQGMKEVDITLKGPGAGRESAVRGLVSSGLSIMSITDTTPIAHNGCRPPKRRRV